MAFDCSLSRLGHGKGYYDRFITRYAAAHGGKRPLLGTCTYVVRIKKGAAEADTTNANTVGLALREQILDAGKIPMDEYDWKVDAIVSPDGILGATGEPSHVPTLGNPPGHTGS